MADHNNFGNKAEELAADFLKKKGYKIIARNFRWQKAEIDIIASFDSKIIIVEVKARNTDAFLEPHEAVNKKKIKNLVFAADQFMQENNRVEEVRFDIISLLPDEKGELKISHIEEAFDAFDAN